MSYGAPFDDGAVYAVVGVTADEYVSAGMLMVRRRQGRSFLVVGAVSAMLVVAFFTLGQVFVAAFVAAYGVLVVTGVLYRSTFTRRYRADPRAGEMIQFRFDPNGFAMAGSGFESRYAWNRVDVVYENAILFMFMIGGDRGIPIPKRCLAPHDVERLRALAAGAVRFS